MSKNRSWPLPHARWGSLLLTFILILAGVSGSTMSGAAAPPGQGGDLPPVIELPPEAFDAVLRSAPQPVKRTGSKLDSSLQELVIAFQTPEVGTQDLRPGLQLNLSESRVQAQIAVDASEVGTVAETVRTAGGEVTGTNAEETLIQAWLPVSAIDQVTALPSVHMIRRPDQALPSSPSLGTGSTTEALSAMNVPAWHAAGQIGAGIKVGVIDTGFEGYLVLLGSDLPPLVQARNFVDGEGPSQIDGTTSHGTACAEIVYDVAPGVDLYLAKASTNLDLQEAVAWLKSQNVDVISTSLTWYNVTPGDGTGEFADLVQGARNNGIFWATAAGNDRETHWGGPFTDRNGNGIHEFDDKEVNCFGPGDNSCYEIEAGETLRVFLRWDDWTEVTQDFDLYLVRKDGTIWNPIASSVDPQEGKPGQRPTEYAIALTSGTPTHYGFYIRRFDSSRTVNFEVFTPKSRGLNERLPARSLGNLADVPGAMTVAALDVDAPYPQEAYSSEGPTNGPGGTAVGGFTKPDIAAYANVSTQGYGFRGFDGTSAATPHVAGAAALVLGQNPHYSPGEVQAFLQSRSLDMGTPGQDTVYGYGRMYLGAPSPPPVITGITPSSGVYTGSIRIVNLAGTQFKPGAGVHLRKSNHAPIPGTNVTWVNENKFTLNLDLTGAANGAWDVVVTNPDGRSGSLEDGFTVLPTANAPRVFGITPTMGTGIVDATVIGRGFATSGTKPIVRLTQVNQEILATQVSVTDSATLTCRFNLEGANGGLWNVVVTNPDGSHWTLSEAFTVTYWLYLPHMVKDYPPPPETLYAVEDTMVTEGNPGANYDTWTEMWAGYDHPECAGGKISRSLLKFDTTGLAAGRPIPQATLYLFLANSCDVPDRSRTVTLHRATSFWYSDSVTWRTQPTMAGAIASVTVPPQQADPWGWYAFDVTELVKGWVNGDHINQGIVLRGPEGSGDDGARLGFITSDYAQGVYAPRIEFTYATQATDASPGPASADKFGCLPQALVPTEPGEGPRQITGERVCPAD